MYKILVTGGAGFIGANFVRLLMNATQYSVVILDKLTYAGNLVSIRDLFGERCHFVQGDICDVALVNALFEKYRFDYVINCAAESHVDRSIEDPSIFLRSNVLGVQVLLDACVRFGIRKFQQMSTDEVYGALGPIGMFSETSPILPSSPYSASKASADLLVQSWHRTYGLPMNITRSSNNYGPYQHPEKLIPRMITNAISDQKLPVYGDGSNIREWIHVHDHCRAVLAVLENGVSGEIYNIGSDCERSNLDVVKQIVSVLGKSTDLIEMVPDRKGHDWRYAVDCTKIQTQLGWVPHVEFSHGLPEVIAWYINNLDWIRSADDGK